MVGICTSFVFSKYYIFSLSDRIIGLKLLELLKTMNDIST